MMSAKKIFCIFKEILAVCCCHDSRTRLFNASIDLDMVKRLIFLVVLSVQSLPIQAQALNENPVKILDGFQFTEGPVVDQNGDLYFSDVRAQKIYKYSNGFLSTFVDNSGGANGLYFDQCGYMVACAGRARQLITLSPDGDILPIIDSYQGKKLNSPNDLWVHPGGGIYFTDPRYGNTDNMEQDGMHVYYLLPDRSDLMRVTTDLVRPNGIIGTPDGKTLYVVDQGVEKTWKYAINADGTLSDKTLFAPCGMDGLSIDEELNIFITNHLSIDRYSEDGERLQSFSFPNTVTNVVCHAGEMFVTTQAGEVYRVDLAD
jgi:gluconolactonase